MTVSITTKDRTTNVQAIIIVAFIALVLVCALVFEPKDGYYGTFWSLVPAVIAIALALITKEVYSSLFVGILIGALIWGDFDFEATINHVVADGFIGSISDPGKAGILLFLVVLGVIGVLLFRSGGVRAYGEWALKHVKNRKVAQLMTFFLGILIFVDDYFNCLTVGSVMRPLTDKFKVSRAKLAYLIDSTAAPICIIAPVSSWAAAVASSMGTATLPGDADPMMVFIECIPYNFYAILTIVMVVSIILLNIDFGPMKKHEENAVQNGDLYTVADRPYQDSEEEAPVEGGHILDLILPIFLFLIPSCIIGLIYTGGFFDGEDFITAFSDCDASVGLSMGSIIAIVMIFVYYIIRGSAAFPTLMDALPKGFRNMVPAITILVFAWTLCTMTISLGSEAFVTDLLADSDSLQKVLPAVFMLLGCFIAFSTGTSWGTMGILIPIVIPVFYGDYDLMIVGISACMAGAVFGDHCSPISDTTIMSSAGSQCSHVVHVSTQAPYAMLVAGVSFVFFLISGFIQTPVMFIIAAAVLVGILFGIKKYTESREASA